MSSRTVFPHWFSIYLKVYPKLMQDHQQNSFLFDVFLLGSIFPFKRKQNAQLSSFYIATFRTSKHFQKRFMRLRFQRCFSNLQSTQMIMPPICAWHITYLARKWVKHLSKRNVMRHICSQHIKLTTKRILKREKKNSFGKPFTYFQAQETETFKRNNLFPKSSSNHVLENFGIGQ